MHDALTESLNTVAGRLAEILIRRMKPGEMGEELSSSLLERFDRLALSRGRFGELARVRFAAEVSLLFERAPQWTTKRIVPLFQWQYEDAPNFWSARKYSNYIGSPKLFELTKLPFLELFSRPTVPDEELRVYGEWLAIIMIANRVDNRGYPITSTEARSALRSAGERAMSSVAHRLATEMEAARPEDKPLHWQNIVGPVFESIWPLDAEIQSPKCTFALVQILRATGKAFAKAADAIIPFVRPEDPLRHTSIHSISEADEEIYAASPSKMLDLVAAVVDEAPPKSVYGLTKVLNRILEQAPQLVESRKFQRLSGLANTF